MHGLDWRGSRQQRREGFSGAHVKNASALSLDYFPTGGPAGGISYLVKTMESPQPTGSAGYQSVLSMLTAAVFGKGSFTTSPSAPSCRSLSSANTAFADFSRLCRASLKTTTSRTFFAIAGVDWLHLWHRRPGAVVAAFSSFSEVLPTADSALCRRRVFSLLRSPSWHGHHWRKIASELE